MKREFLSSLGFCKGAIDAVMNVHSREIGEHVRRQKRLQRRILKLEKRLFEFKQLNEIQTAEGTRTAELKRGEPAKRQALLGKKLKEAEETAEHT